MGDGRCSCRVRCACEWVWEGCNAVGCMGQTAQCSTNNSVKETIVTCRALHRIQPGMLPAALHLRSHGWMRACRRMAAAAAARQARRTLKRVRWPARVCFWTGMIFMTSSLRAEPRKYSTIWYSFTGMEKR